MDQEQLIRQITAEVLKSLGQTGQATATRQAKPAAAHGKIGVAQYPLAEKSPELVVTDSGVPLAEITFDKVLSGQLSAKDLRISANTLELQAQVADDSGRAALARNLRRAAELVAVPDDRLLSIYNALRPYRSTKAELYAIADELDGYGAAVSAGFVREAAEVYEARGRLRVD